MKIDAVIDVVEASTGNVLDTVTVPVDMDYVEGNEEAVTEWIEHSDKWHEVESNWQRAGKLVQFNVTNMEDIVEDIAYDEFIEKTQYANA